jgi:dihydrodipicolinate synthase/N-acetylneuraminate lyase
MSTAPFPRPLRGIVPPLATPLAAIDALDVPGLERLVEHILGGGVDALFILGTTGEGPALSYRVRRELIERVCQQVGKRVPVLVGISDAAYAESLHVAEIAARAGAAAVVAAPPFYFQFSQSDLFKLIESLARDSALPVYLYNQPGLTKMVFEPESVARSAEIPNILGIKDSSGDMDYLKKVIALVAEKHPEYSILVGPEHLLAEGLMAGAHGGVPGGANIFPHLPVRVYQAFKDGKFDEMKKAHAQLVAAGDPIWSSNETEPVYIRRLKCALSVMGLCSGIPTWPYHESLPGERREIEAHLRQQGILKP